jgi:hypothetical protein
LLAGAPSCVGSCLDEVKPAVRAEILRFVISSCLRAIADVVAELAVVFQRSSDSETKDGKGNGKRNVEPRHLHHSNGSLDLSWNLARQAVFRIANLFVSAALALDCQEQIARESEPLLFQDSFPLSGTVNLRGADIFGTNRLTEKWIQDSTIRSSSYPQFPHTNVSLIGSPSSFILRLFRLTSRSWHSGHLSLSNPSQPKPSIYGFCREMGSVQSTGYGGRCQVGGHDDLSKEAVGFLGILFGGTAGLIGGILFGSYLGLPNITTVSISMFSVGGAALFAFARLNEASTPPQIQEVSQESSQAQSQHQPESDTGA